MITGIDVSAYQQPPFQRARIDWQAVAAAGHRFAIIKTTEGARYVNEHFTRDRRLAREAGLLVGSYHFGRWEPIAGVSPEADGRAEAEHYARTLGDLQPGDISPALDLEWITGQKRPAPEIAAFARAFLERVEALTGRWPGIYVGPNFYRYQVKDLVLSSWWLWEVDYSGGREPKPMPGAPEWRWSIWQTTGMGSCPGVEGKCDVNVARDWETLRKLAALPPDAKGA